MVPRQKIRAYITRVASGGNDPSRENKTGKLLSKAYSGFVHAAAPHILDMYGGNPPKFYLAGMLNTPRISEHTDDIWNYFYRGLITFIGAAKAFGNAQLVDELSEYWDKFEEASGTNFRERKTPNS